MLNAVPPDTRLPSRPDRASPAPVETPSLPSLAEATRLWLKIGLLSFGGPVGQIALLHREVVDLRRWISDRRFLHALNFCHLLPGPEAQQLAIYLGWLMHGARGGLVAGALFVIPGALVMLALSIVYALYGAVPVVTALFFGLKSAVLLLVVEALQRIARRALKTWAARLLAVVSFLALFVFAVPFPLVVLAGALVGGLAPAAFGGTVHEGDEGEPPALLDRVLAAEPDRARRLARDARRAGLCCALAWALTLVVLASVGGRYGEIAVFFSKMAAVTFGGAYAVLAYVGQEAVQRLHWLTAPEMLAGLGLAETTPGPLILVLQFVGFLAGYRAPGGLSGVLGGASASALTLWVTFLPCFAFVFLGAPLVERVQGARRLTGALSGVTAAVVGVVANLAVWFALHVFFRQTILVHAFGLHFERPVLASLDVRALALATLAGLGLFVLRLGVVPTLALCALAGAAAHLAGVLG